VQSKAPDKATTAQHVQQWEEKNDFAHQHMTHLKASPTVDDLRPVRLSYKLYFLANE
jgi:hypothetical protein